MLRTFMFIFLVKVGQGELEYNFMFVGLGSWGVRGSERKIC